MKIGFMSLIFLSLLLSGCGKTIISPSCNLTDFSRNDELSQIALSVQVSDVREDSEKFFLQNSIYKAWEESSTHFNRYQLYLLSQPSSQLLQESLSEAFKEYGYNASQDSGVILKLDLTRFLYNVDGYQNIVYAEIKSNLSIVKDDVTLLRKSFSSNFQQPINMFRQYEDSESVLSQCLTQFVEYVVFDQDMENELRKLYGMPIQVELAKIPKIDDSPEKDEEITIIGTGTGFAVCENGYIVTAYHVVDEASSVYVKFQDAEWLPATIIQKSLINDVAILKVDENIKYFLRISDKLRQGEKIFTLGYPAPGLLGEEPKYSDGTVSSVTGIVDEASLMQISIPLQPGNSGGPLLNENAEVVGMATRVANVDTFYNSTGTLPQNVNWGVKAAFIMPLLPEDCIASDPVDGETKIDPIEFASKAVCLIKAESR